MSLIGPISLIRRFAYSLCRALNLEDEDSLPDEAFALSAPISVRERSRDDENECRLSRLA